MLEVKEEVIMVGMEAVHTEVIIQVVELLILE
jgi:hypothetical protein